MTTYAILMNGKTVVRGIVAPGQASAMSHYLAMFSDADRPERVSSRVARVKVGPHIGARLVATAETPDRV